MPMLAGVHRNRITPDGTIEGSYRLSYRKRPAGVHDDLHVTAVHLACGSARLLLISLDLLAIRSDQNDALKSRLQRELGLAAHEVVVLCTHTHNAQDMLDEEKRADPRLWREVESSACDAAARAAETAAPARLGFAEACLPVAVNRLDPGAWDDPTVSLGAVDPICDLLRVESLDGKPIALLFHYAAHPTAAMGAEFRISRDCVGVACDRLEARLGGAAVFLQGAAGDVNFHLGKRTYDAAKRVGAAIADALAPVAGRIVCDQTDPALRSLLESLDVPNRSDIDFNVEELDARVRQLKSDYENLVARGRPESEVHPLYNRWRHEASRVSFARSLPANPTTRVDVQAIRIGDTRLLALPGEHFVGHQLALRRRFFPNRAIFLGYAHGYVGYVPTLAAMKLGGYGTEPAERCRLKVGAGLELLQHGAAMLDRLW